MSDVTYDPYEVLLDLTASQAIRGCELFANGDVMQTSPVAQTVLLQFMPDLIMTVAMRACLDPDDITKAIQMEVDRMKLQALSERQACDTKLS